MGSRKTPFRVGGVMWDRKVWTRSQGRCPRSVVLGDILQPTSEVPDHYFVPEGKVDTVVLSQGREG